MRRVMSLDGEWRFMPDMRDAGVREGWHRPDASDGGWRRVPVPQAWDSYDEAFRGYEGVAWLRKRFRWNGARPAVAVLRFAGVGHHADVWLNGRELGSHDGSYVPFSLDARPPLRRGGNVLAVRIRNVFDDKTMPIRNTDWWKYGGITRPVALLTNDGPTMSRVTVLTGGNPAKPPILCVMGTVTGFRRGLTVAASVRAPGRAPIRSHPVDVKTSGEFTAAISGRGLPLWSPDSPHLLTLTLVLCDRAGRALDRVTRRVGIRVLAWDGGRLKLNGKPLFLRGVNQVEEYPNWTCSPGRAAMRARVLDIKRNLHANFFRAAHYPHHPGFLDLCDELGLLTAVEIPLCYHPELPDTTHAGKQMLDSTFWEYAHHPSVVWWSCGNERPTGDKSVARGVARLIRHAKSLDPSRPVTCVSNRGLGDLSLAAHDILVLNEYFGVWGGTTPVTVRGLDRAARELSRELDAVHRAFPGKPLIIGEFGAPAFPVPGDVFGGERWQAEIFRSQLKVIASKPFVSGCAAWCYMDQRMGSYGRYPVGYLGSTQLEVFGLKTLAGRAKPAWRVIARFYRRLARGRLLPRRDGIQGGAGFLV
jgi:beta-glucuronidase